MMRLADPWWLALLPLVLWLAWHRQRPGRKPAVLFSSLKSLVELPKTGVQRLRRVLPWMEVIGLLALVVALARPQAGRVDVDLSTEGIAIQLVIDRSGSMAAPDLDEDPWDRRRVTRLDVVRTVVRDFVDAGGTLPGRKNDLIGLVTFTGFVQTHCPLTLDHDVLAKIIDGVELFQPAKDDPHGEELTGTALGDGLVTAVTRLREIPIKSKVIVLLSDGRGNVGIASPEAAAEMAKEAGIKIYAVGIGSARGDLDSELLEKIAKDTGGSAFNARTAADLRDCYAEIDRLERSEITALSATRWRELYLPLVALGLALLAVHRLFFHTRFRSLP